VLPVCARRSPEYSGSQKPLDRSCASPRRIDNRTHPSASGVRGLTVSIPNLRRTAAHPRRVPHGASDHGLHDSDGQLLLPVVWVRWSSRRRWRLWSRALDRAWGEVCWGCVGSALDGAGSAGAGHRDHNCGPSDWRRRIRGDSGGLGSGDTTLSGVATPFIGDCGHSAWTCLVNPTADRHACAGGDQMPDDVVLRRHR